MTELCHASRPAARYWELGGRRLDLGRTRIMGVINVTPDSFSDAGLHADACSAVEWGMQLLEDGADILDVGGESTRPGFSAVEVQEEKARVIPVISALAKTGACISVDTRHAEVARAALESGACIVNDVSAFVDPAMIGVVERASCGVIAMHSCRGFLGTSVGALGVPASGDSDPETFVSSVENFLLQRAHMLEAHGIASDRICIDPGPGFGTVPDEDLAVQAQTERFVHLGYPYLCAPSRKRFVGAVSGVHPACARDAASAGVCCAAVARGARMVRVHDVKTCAEAIRCLEAVQGLCSSRRAYIGIGSNMGDRFACLRAALEGIGGLAQTRLIACSHIYETEPAYYLEQAPFANAVIEIQTALHPRALLEALLLLEQEAGRVRTRPMGPRPLDLDLLWMEGEHISAACCTCPHPRMAERDFVLVPLSDLVGDVEAFCRAQHIELVPPDKRVGHVMGDLGTPDACL